MKNKFGKLFLSLLLDAIGYLSYTFPLIGEYGDILWAPLSALILSKIYQNNISKHTRWINFIEEALPFTDFVPSFTLTWVLTYFSEKKLPKPLK